MAIAEDEDEDDEGVALEDEKDLTDTALEVVDGDDGAEKDAAGAATAKAETGSDDWRAEFERVEEAWLAGRTLGDPHEALNFLHLLSDLRLEDAAPSRIIAAFDRFRVRTGGERFSYCPLHGAVHLVRMRKPSLDNALVVVRYRELARLPPCTGLEDCPGVGEVLSHTRR